MEDQLLQPPESEKGQAWDESAKDSTLSGQMGRGSVSYLSSAIWKTFLELMGNKAKQ